MAVKHLLQQASSDDKHNALKRHHKQSGDTDSEGTVCSLFYNAPEKGLQIAK